MLHIIWSIVIGFIVGLIARAVMLDIAGLDGVDCLPDGHVITPDDLQAAAREQKTELRPKDVILLRTGRMTRWPDFDGYIPDNPGLGLGGGSVLGGSTRGERRRSRPWIPSIRPAHPKLPTSARRRTGVNSA